MSESEFAIYAIPIANYSIAGAKPFDPIAAEDDARTIADLLVPLGGTLHEWSAETERDAAWVREQLAGWADRGAPGSSVLLWVGHGESDGNDAWLASFGTTRNKQGTGHNPDELANHMYDEWSTRQKDTEAWTLVVIEACGAERFVELLLSRLTGKPNAPDRFALLSGGGRGSSFLTKVPRALRAVMDSYPNDEVIRIHDFVGRLEDRLDPGRAFVTGLSRSRPFRRPAEPLRGITAPLDVYAELKQYIAGLPADQRAFFVPRAQGTELGEPTWYFEGRDRERREITDWLNTSATGLLVVTGPAGSGKSAVLGNLIVHTNPGLRDLLIESGQVKRLAEEQQPADNVFDAAVLLTGLSTADVVERLTNDLGLDAVELDSVTKVEGLCQAVAGRALTVMVDALDEAQDPLDVAGVLRKLGELPRFRVVVGTRRSTTEGPDLPEPLDTNLLDALGKISKVAVGIDPDAVTRYVVQRLSAQEFPAGLGIDATAVTSVALSVGLQKRHFLYARLVVHEILARPELLTDAGRPELTALLAEDHRGLFAAAVRRLTAADRSFGPLLEALAHARGRGMPRADGIWATAAGAFIDGRRPGEADLDNLLDAGAPYVMLDAENGQSTYRLAHQTFVEYYHEQEPYAAGHRRISAALGDAIAGNWTAANFYAVRYLSEHLVADADRIPPDADSLAALVADAGWLPRAIELIGVDQTVVVISAARAVIQDSHKPDWPLNEPNPVQHFDVVERTLRRSRIALARDPAQLPAQLHARLKEFPEDVLRGSTSRAPVSTLGDAIGRTTPSPWLRMTEGNLDWRADLESTYGTVGKVRALAFGRIDNGPVIAIGVDTRVELWDPRTGVPDVAATIEVGHRPTAIAMSSIDERPVLVTTATYDSLVEVWDTRSGERLYGTGIGLGHALGVGEVNGRLVIAGVPDQYGLTFLDAMTLKPVDVLPGLADRQIRGFGVDNGHLLVLAVEDAAVIPHDPPSRAHSVLVLDPDDGSTICWTEPVAAESSMLDVMAGARIGATLVVAAGIEDRMFWFASKDKYVFTGGDPLQGRQNVSQPSDVRTRLAAHVEPSPYDRRTRAIAVGEVDGRGIVASAPDYDGTALVQLQEFASDTHQGEVRLSRQRETGQARTAQGRFEPVPVPARLGQAPPRNVSGNRPMPLDRPENWPHLVAAEGFWDGSAILATGSVEGAVWIWDAREFEHPRPTERPHAIAGPFVRLPPYVLERGWDMLAVKPPIERATSVALGNLPGRGPVVAVACAGRARLYSIADERRIESPADEAAVDCLALGPVNGRTVLVTGSTGGNVTVWDPAASRRVCGLALDEPVMDVRIEASTDGRGQIAVRTGGKSYYTLQLMEPS